MTSVATLLAAGGLQTTNAQEFQLLNVTNTVWKYHTNIVDPGYIPADAWTAPAFDDNSWPGGQGLFGRETTPDEYLPNFFQTFISAPAQGGGVSCYFRTHFQWTNSPIDAILVFTNWVDDGIVVYLNGVELFAFNMPARPVAWNNGALPNGANPLGEGVAIITNVVPSNLVQGDNVLAVQLQQQATTSSDDVFGMMLHGIAPFAPVILDANQPSNRIVLQHRSSTLSFVANASPPRSYQWYFQQGTNGGAFNPILDATNASYTIPDMSAADEGLYYAVLSNPLGTVNSRTAVVRYTEDAAPPAVVRILPTPDPYKVVVVYSEVVASNTAVDVFNYGSPVNPPPFLVATAALMGDGSRVLLTLDTPLPWESQSSLRIISQSDLAGNVLNEATVDFLTGRIIGGFGLEELFMNIGNGTSVGDLTGNAKYPDGPDATSFLGLAEGPVNRYDSYGTRISGWLVPPVTGNYNFWMCSDDRGEFWLSADDSTTNLVRIAFEPEWNASRDYYTTALRNAAAPENASKTLFPTGIPLNAGQKYYFRLLAKEGTGGDNASVAWQIPGQPQPTTPIAGAYMAAPFDPLATASITITQQPAAQVGVVLPAPDVPPIHSVDFSTGNGGYTVSNVIDAAFTTPAGPWNYNAASGSWTNFGVDACEPAGTALPKATALMSPPVTLTTSGKLYVVFRHRYSFEESDKPYDGGQVRYSLNGGAYTNVVSSNKFVAFPYSRVIGGTGLFLSQAAFGGNSPGYTSGDFITSIAEVGTFNANDVISIEFMVNWDECTTALAPSWEIKSVQLTFSPPPAPVLVSFSVAAESLLNGAPNGAYSYLWQRDSGSGFEDIIGQNGSTLTLTVTLADNGTRVRAIVYSPGAVATSGVATVTVTVPLEVARGNGVITISWPSQAVGFVLEGSPALGSAASWTDVPPASYQTTPSKIFVTVPSTSGNRFYRLIKR